MTSLYEIDQQIVDCLTDENGEFVDVTEDAEAMKLLEDLQVSRQAKIENICLYIKNLRADAAAYKAEKDAFEQKRKSAQNKADRLAKYLEDVLQGETFKSTKATVGYRTSFAVEIDDENLISDDYSEYEKKINKTLIKQAIKEGKQVEGARLVAKTNIQVK